MFEQDNIFGEKKIFCLNCGKLNHTISTCTFSTSSFGVINLKFTGKFEKYNYIFKNKYIIKDTKPDINKINMFWFNNKNLDKDCNDLIKELKDSILFLLVSRKNSLGYIEFIRGKYKIDDICTIKHLFDQMTENEITNIITNDFDFLWCELWKKSSRNKIYEKEYEISSEKFKLLKETLLETIKTYRPKYPIPEWGFPKGRRHYMEKDITCAIRECCEETSLNKSEINVLDRIYPLVEEFKGTNGIDYRNVYFLSIIDNPRELYADTTYEQNIEIGFLGWFKYNKVSNLIRPYHTEKKKIIDDIIKFIAYNISYLEIKNSLTIAI